LPCLALPCLALPCLALPCLALPCLALPCLALPFGVVLGSLSHSSTETEEAKAALAEHQNAIFILRLYL
jgi:hypothetical protein